MKKVSRREAAAEWEGAWLMAWLLSKMPPLGDRVEVEERRQWMRNETGVRAAAWIAAWMQREGIAPY